jgi:putative membrane protein
MPAGRAEDHKDHKTGLKASGAKSHEASFIEHAAQGGLMEVKMGQLAQQKGQSSEIKQFGQKLVQDHTKANAELMQIAQKKGITLEKTLDAKHQSHLDKLTAATGAEFDKAFAKDALKTHKKTIAKFEKAVTSEKDEDVKNFAQKTLPVLREHLQTAQVVAKSVGLNESDITAALQADTEHDAQGTPGTDIQSQTGQGASEPKRDYDATKDQAPKNDK